MYGQLASMVEGPGLPEAVSDNHNNNCWCPYGVQHRLSKAIRIDLGDLGWHSSAWPCLTLMIGP
jgi:hypothetical protein